jgi:hypothetical protein
VSVQVAFLEKGRTHEERCNHNIRNSIFRDLDISLRDTKLELSNSLDEIVQFIEPRPW